MTNAKRSHPLARKNVFSVLLLPLLPRVEEFKCPGVSLTSEGKTGSGIDGRISAASALMQLLYRSVVVKKARSQKAKLSIFKDKSFDKSGFRNICMFCNLYWKKKSLFLFLLLCWSIFSIDSIWNYAVMYLNIVAHILEGHYKYHGPGDHWKLSAVESVNIHWWLIGHHHKLVAQHLKKQNKTLLKYSEQLSCQIWNRCWCKTSGQFDADNSVTSFFFHFWMNVLCQ